MGKSMDDEVQRGKVQGTTYRKNMTEYTIEGKILEKEEEEEEMGVMVHKAMNGSRQVAAL